MVVLEAGAEANNVKEAFLAYLAAHDLHGKAEKREPNYTCV
jgi:hypothetical protein